MAHLCAGGLVGVCVRMLCIKRKLQQQLYVATVYYTTALGSVAADARVQVGTDDANSEQSLFSRKLRQPAAPCSCISKRSPSVSCGEREQSCRAAAVRRYIFTLHSAAQ
jgi:hypothetical protein